MKAIKKEHDKIVVEMTSDEYEVLVNYIMRANVAMNPTEAAVLFTMGSTSAKIKQLRGYW